MPNRYKVLSDLLLRLFTRNFQLKEFLESTLSYANSARLIASLPDSSVPQIEFINRAIKTLESHGLLSSEFFQSLESEFPGAIEIINRARDVYLKESVTVDTGVPPRSEPPNAAETGAQSVFISYSSSDRDFASVVADRLEENGFRCWQDIKAIKPGDSIVESIESALEAVDHFLIVLSPQATASRWVRKELNAAHQVSILKDEFQIIPLMYQPCRIPLLLQDSNLIDFTQAPALESNLARLVGALQAAPSPSGSGR